MTERIRLGVSSCLLGADVRFDGGHKHDRFLTDTLGQYVEFVPVCPGEFRKSLCALWVTLNPHTLSPSAPPWITPIACSRWQESV